MKRLTPRNAYRGEVGQRIASERDEAGRVWCQLFPLGEWHRADFPGGRIELTTKLLSEFIANWKREGSPALPVDYHHEEQDEASGWIEDLRISATGALEGAIKWTDDAAALIKADKYRYLSPTWTMAYVSRTSGEKAGPWLYGAALLNDPFFHSMPRVAASSADADESTHHTNQEKHHMDKKRICAALGLSEDCGDEEVMAAIEAKCKATAAAGEEAGKLTAALKSASDDTAKLMARVTELEAKDAKHAEELFERDFEAAYDEALRAGRQGLPALKETLKATAKVAGLGLDAAKKMMASLPTVPLTETGISGKPTDSVGDAAKQFANEVAEKQKAGLSYVDAVRAVTLSNKALADKAFPLTLTTTNPPAQG